MATEKANGHHDASKADAEAALVDIAKRSKEASFALQSASLAAKSAALKAIWNRLQTDKAQILEANKQDLKVGLGAAASRLVSGIGGLTSVFFVSKLLHETHFALFRRPRRE